MYPTITTGAVVIVVLPVATMIAICSESPSMFIVMRMKDSLASDDGEISKSIQMISII